MLDYATPQERALINARRSLSTPDGVGSSMQTRADCLREGHRDVAKRPQRCGHSTMYAEC